MLTRLALTVALLGLGAVAFAAEPQKLPTRIEIDQAKGEVVIIIKGQPAARIVSSGLIVPGDVRFTGRLVDGEAN